MNKASQAASELRAMDALSSGDSPIHRLHPLAKLLITILYIFLTVSFSKYSLSAMACMVLYPVFLFQASGIPVRTCFYKMRYVLPFVMAVGVVNPFLDRTPMLYLGRMPVSGGVISMLTLMLKGVFSLMASFLLIATTKVDALCAALQKLHVPKLLISLFLLTFRYISVMVEQVSIMSNAYALRAPGQKGIHISAWGSFLGQLILRSIDKAGELFQSMQLRGFHGEFCYAGVKPWSRGDTAFTLISAVLLILFRYVDIALLLGSLFV